ncbi:MAG: hypothetical protein JW981_00255 [Anaerolineae bacterium]|nr:hypothetical protein [Anaerolineae bacterium]
MNIFNRVVVVILVLLLMAGVTFTAITPHVVLTNMGNQLVAWGAALNQLQPAIRLGGGVLAVLLFDLLGIFLLVLELRPKRKRFIHVQQVSGGMATISSESIVQQLIYALDPLPGVVKVKPEVTAKKDMVEAIVEVTVSPDGNVPEMASQLVETVQKVLTSELGLRIAKEPQIRIKVAAPSGRRKAKPSQPPQKELEKAKVEDREPEPKVPPLPGSERPSSWVNSSIESRSEESTFGE